MCNSQPEASRWLTHLALKSIWKCWLSLLIIYSALLTFHTELAVKKRKKRMHALSCNCTKDAQQASGACIPRPLCTNTAAGAIKAASAGRSLDIKWAWGMFAALSKQRFNIWNGTGALTFWCRRRNTTMRWGEGVWNCLCESILQLLTGKWVFLSEWEWEVLPSASDLVYAWAVRCSLRTYSKLTSSCSTLRSRGTLWISLTRRFLEKSPTCISLCANITTENICTAIRARMKLLYKCIAATKTFVHGFK